MKLKDYRNLFLSILICNLAGAIGSIFTMPAIDSWYSNLVKPALNPPSWVFGPVWTTLYILMGVAAFIVYNHGWKKVEVKIALSIFGFQLILNTLWSIIFFGFQNPGLAFVEVVLLWTMIVLTIVSFSKISKKAAILLVPYLLWVSFASYLNLSLFLLN
ncbi:MAG: TspO/MBR family protein [Candidatus Magasanikbacteria bacterium]|nr:TspO/MBR family protein [Candidatus Magasanikbacteria bacterium]